jgi:hypothetical protein
MESWVTLLSSPVLSLQAQKIFIGGGLRGLWICPFVKKLLNFFKIDRFFLPELK